MLLTQSEHPERGHIRTGLVVLIGSLLALIFSLFVIGTLVESANIFGPSGDDRIRKNTYLLNVADLAAVKAAHAIRMPTYSSGLFGNSRAIAVSHSDVGLPEVDFFNFAVGGTSFRQSVAFIEYLSAHDKTPRTAIISVDNHDIGFVGSIYWPPLFLLPQRLLFDDAPAKNPDQSRFRRVGSTTHELVDWWRTVCDQIRAYLNFTRLKSRLLFIASNAIGVGDNGENYLSDGATAGTPVTAQNIIMKQDLDGLSKYYLRLVEADMWRLAKIQARGTKIVIYESPIHPELLEKLESERLASVQVFRARFMTLCQRYALTCTPAPVLTADLPWSDCCHAPAAPLGKFINTLLR